jgi:hypothetical protein
MKLKEKTQSVCAESFRSKDESKAKKAPPKILDNKFAAD